MQMLRSLYWSFPLVTCLAVLPLSLAERGKPMPSSSHATSGPTVTTSAGIVEGQNEGDLRVFKGIPYAAPPVGQARWKPPSKMTPWSGVRRMIEFGPACAQPPGRDGSIYSSDLGPTSEDCLTLNVWAPMGARKDAVFVWIHGGSLVTGSSKERVYDGARLAAQGI